MPFNYNIFEMPDEVMGIKKQQKPTTIQWQQLPAVDVVVNKNSQFLTKDINKSDYAKQNNINNDLPESLQDNANESSRYLQQIESEWNKQWENKRRNQPKMIFSSGFRNEELNKRLNGESDSQHTQAQAYDVQVSGNNRMLKQLFNFIKNHPELKQGIDQMLYESNGKTNWIHISHVKDDYKRPDDARLDSGYVGNRNIVKDNYKAIKRTK